MQRIMRPKSVSTSVPAQRPMFSCVGGSELQGFLNVSSMFPWHTIAQQHLPSLRSWPVLEIFIPTMFATVLGTSASLLVTSALLVVTSSTNATGDDHCLRLCQGGRCGCEASGQLRWIQNECGLPWPSASNLLAPS